MIELHLYTDYTEVHKCPPRVGLLLDDALRYLDLVNATSFNPGYASGRWDGYIRLYDRYRSRFPSGLLPRVKALLAKQNHEFAVVNHLSSVEPSEQRRLDCGLELRPYQREAVDAALAYKRGVIQIPTGGGKTLVAQHLIYESCSPRVVFLVPSRVLLNQTYKRYKAAFPDSLVLKWGDSSNPREYHNEAPENYILIATVQSAWKEKSKLLDQATMVIVDECFVAGTQVDGKPIESIKVGDTVKAFYNGSVHLKKVTNVFRKAPSALVKVRLQNGQEFVCTPNHPFFVGDGYRPACMLESGSMVFSNMELNNARNKRYVFELPGRRIGKGEAAKRALLSMLREVPGQPNCVLYERVPGSSGIEAKQYDYATDQFVSQGISVGTDERKKSYVSDGDARESENYLAGYGVETNSSEGERHWSNTSAAVASFRFGLGYGSRYSDAWFNDPENTVQLQSGYCEPSTESSDRSGREQSLLLSSPSSRQEENPVLVGIRVDCVEVLEPTSDGTFGGMCPDGFVYNIEVEDAHNYFVDGVLVHNCHHQAADTFKKATQSATSARYIMGLSATPFRDDGADLEIEAWIGRSIYSITYESLIEGGYLAAPEFHTVRNLDELMQLTQGIRTILFSEKIKDLEDHALDFASRGIRTVTGRHATKDIQAAIGDLDAGRITHLAATPIFDEGFDMPNIGAICFFAAGRSKVRAIQRIGRGLRPADGKDRCLVIDFIDDAYRDRIAAYQTEPAFRERLGARKA